MEVLLKILPFVAIVLSILALLLYFLGKLDPMPTSEKISQWSLISKLTSIALPIVLIGWILLFNIHGIDDNEQKSMNESLRETYANISSSKAAISKINISDMVTIAQEIGVAFSGIHGEIKSVMKLNELNDLSKKFDKTVFKMVENLNTLSASLEESMPNDCPLNHTIQQLVDGVNGLKIVGTDRVEFHEIDADFENQSDLIRDLPMKLGELRSFVTILKDFITNFENDINESQNVKDEWKTKIRPTFGMQKIFSVYFNITVGILAVISLLLFFDAFFSVQKYIGECIWSKTLVIIFFTITSLSIVNSVGVAAISFDFLPKFSCPLNGDNFGLPNFITSMDIERSNIKKSFIVCSTDSTFFSVFGNQPIIKKESIISNLPLRDLMEKEIIILNNMKKIQVVDHEHIKDLLEYIWKTNERITQWSRSDCFDQSLKPYLKAVQEDFDYCLNIGQQLISICNTINAKLHQSASIFEPTLKKWHKKSVHVLSKVVTGWNVLIREADINCNPIREEFALVGTQICREIETPVGKYWMYLSAIVIGHLVFVMVYVLSYHNELGFKKCGFLRKTIKKKTLTKTTFKSETTPKPTRAPSPKPAAIELVVDPIICTPVDSSKPSSPIIDINTVLEETDPAVKRKDQLQKLKEYNVQMNKQEASDGRSEKFQKRGPIVMHLVGIDEIPKNLPEDEEVILSQVVYTPSLNEQFDIGTEIDVLGPEVLAKESVKKLIEKEEKMTDEEREVYKKEKKEKREKEEKERKEKIRKNKRMQGKQKREKERKNKDKRKKERRSSHTQSSDKCETKKSSMDSDLFLEDKTQKDA